MDFNQTCTHTCWDVDKNSLNLCDLDPIFKVTQNVRMLENSLSESCIQKKWMDFDQACTYILFGHGQELIR